MIDAIGISSEETAANPQTPIFSQGQRDISVAMIRAIVDRWIQKTEPTKTPTEWKAAMPSHKRLLPNVSGFSCSGRFGIVPGICG